MGKGEDTAQAELVREQETEETVVGGELRGEERWEEEEEEEEVVVVMKGESELKLGPPGPPFGIVINGHSLVSGAVFSCAALVRHDDIPLTAKAYQSIHLRYTFAGLNEYVYTCAHTN